METTKPHGFINLGGKDKSVDHNDIMLGAAAPAYTHPVVLTDKMAWQLNIEYQRDQPACGAHAGAETKAIRKGKRMSPRFTWGDIKTFDGYPIEDGTDIRSIFKSITKTGTLDFANYWNEAGLSLPEYAKAPTAQLRALAGKNSGDGYGFIKDLSFDGLKQFITDHGPTIVLLRVGKEWWTDKKGHNSWAEKDILPLRVPASVVSGHFIVAHSFDEKYIYFLNHWSEAWGRKGHGYFGADYMPFVNDAGALFPLKFQKDLSVGMSDSDVTDLQKYLNSHGYQVAPAGQAGGPGSETNHFGPLTQDALKKFQAAAGIKPVSGYFGPLTRAYVQIHP